LASVSVPEFPFPGAVPIGSFDCAKQVLARAGLPAETIQEAMDGERNGSEIVKLTVRIP